MEKELDVLEKFGKVVDKMTDRMIALEEWKKDKQHFDYLMSQIDWLREKESFGKEYVVWFELALKSVGALYGDIAKRKFKTHFKIDKNITDYGDKFRYYLSCLDSLPLLLEDFSFEIQLGRTKYNEKTKQLSIVNYPLHPSIEKVSGKLFQNEHNKDAVRNAFVEVINRVKAFLLEKTGEELDGEPLMGKVFAEGREIIAFGDTEKRSDKDEQKGLGLLFRGIVGIRNKMSHQNDMTIDSTEALEYLGLASVLMRKLDSAGIK